MYYSSMHSLHVFNMCILALKYLYFFVTMSVIFVASKYVQTHERSG